ncbi:unnamed protein product [Prunus armeniaca]|uniref:Embryo surrounding factor 1 brassicaceae domain-containing protein n=1 Tax=Prunus armeniaca TaxID=36596 RepID=A0A6J5Y073_PRUAR|nr:unnamed protein product [Prunus armeniaca]CAB4317922.1 unnamed protein product [Prunus armeniaca]
MAIKVQLVLFCMAFIALLALSECNESSIGETSSEQSNVVESLRVRGDVVKVWGSKLTFCSEQCAVTHQRQQCWCCAINQECWPTQQECHKVCDPK